MSTSTTHEITSRVLRTGLRPPGAPQAGCRRRGIHPGDCRAGRAGL